MDPYSIFAVPLALLLLVSGLLCNAIELVLVLVLLPISRNLYRRTNAAVTGSYWSQMVWLVEWWGGLKLVIFCKPEVWDQFGTENAIVMSNHRSDVDWIVGWILAQRSGCLGASRALMKKVLQYLPVIGWSMWFSEYIFLARDWSQDQSVMKSSFERMRDFPLPFWLAIFPEGTRFTPKKLKDAQSFAEARGLPVPQNTLVPRTKGFQMSVEYLRDFVPTIIDVTLVVPEGVPQPTFTGFLSRRRSEMHLLISRVPMTTLPKDAEGISEWCKDSFVRKDTLLEEHKKTNSFDPKLLLPTSPSKSTIVHTVLWSSLVLSLSAWLLHQFLGTVVWNRETRIITGAIVLGMLGVVQVLIFFTKSEYSSDLSGKAKRQKKDSAPLRNRETAKTE